MALLTIADDEAALAAAAADRITTLIEDAIAAHGAATWALAGGRTPERLYQRLAGTSRIDWTRVHVYWSDERQVPPDHRDSNYGMAARALLDHVPIPPAHVHRIHAELPDAADAARAYESELPEAFDVMLLGLGDDAHIASIFPGSPLLASLDDPRPSSRAAAVWVPHLHAWRITLTPAVILASHAIVALVAGAAKADAVHAALEGDGGPLRHPAQLLRRTGDRVEWFLDRAAAARLRAAPPA